MHTPRTPRTATVVASPSGIGTDRNGLIGAFDARSRAKELQSQQAHDLHHSISAKDSPSHDTGESHAHHPPLDKMIFNERAARNIDAEDLASNRLVVATKRNAQL